jgi:hypothetical protein
MATKLRRHPPDPESLTDLTEGWLKAGIELSIAELNKLSPLWDNRNPLPPDKLAALNTEAFAEGSAGEFVATLKLKGRAGQRGMVWVIPIFQPFDITLSTVQSTDDAAQVLTAAHEHVVFPLPVSARVIGLLSD